MSDQANLETLASQIEPLADEIEVFIERVDAIYQQTVALIPAGDGEAMANGEKHKSSAYLLGERLWFLMTTYLEPAVQLLRPQATEEDEEERATLEKVQSVLDQAIAGLDPKTDVRRIQALRELRGLAAEMDEVHQLGLEYERRSSIVRLTFARLALELSPDTAKLLTALGLPLPDKVHHE